MSEAKPQLGGVLETVLYFGDQQRCEHFYSEVLGMRLIGKEPGRSLFYRAGRSVFLLFDARATRRPGKLPPHGADGAMHTCFWVEPGQYARWKQHLAGHGVAITAETEWPRGQSFYFEDPDGNVLEIANSDIWPE